MSSTSSLTSLETIALGGGCFWCTEAVFDRVDGVVDVESGYSNGQVRDPSYEQVCTGQTGHAEVVKLQFDPARLSLREILEIFFVVHDPTTLNRQGPDWGTQYRSAIFFHSPEQEAAAKAKIEALTTEGRFAPKRIVTKVEPAQTFWRAEEYHQRYLEKRGLASCHI